MNTKSRNNKFNKTISIFFFYTLVFTFIIPTQTLAKPVPANSVFNQNNQEQIENDEPKLDKSFGNIPVYFEENNGQFNSKVKYFARGTNSYSLFLTATEAVYVLRSPESNVRSQKFKDDSPTLNSEHRTIKSRATAVFMKLVGANETSQSVGLERMPHKTNYFKSEELKWQTEIPNFKKIQMKNVYQGIDTVWKGKENGGIQYDFVVKPNANPNQIEWEIKGAESVEIKDNGDLLVKTEFGTIKQQKPFTYQENTNGLRQEVQSKFVIKETEQSTIVSFEVGNYDRTKTLTIDPSVNLSNLAFSTFLGGSDADEGEAIAVDRAGNVYVTGETESTSFPTTAGTFDTSQNSFDDVFVSKLNASGTELIYSTFLGGNGRDTATDIAIDSSGNAYITGFTFRVTTDYPTTTGAFDEVHNGDADAFATKLNPTGSALVYSTFLGGGRDDLGIGITVDALGNAFVTGRADNSTTAFPTTAGAFDTTHNGNDDVFVTKLNVSGSALIYSTFIGGGAADQGNSIKVDTSGNAFIAGRTNSTGAPLFPRTLGAFQFFSSGPGSRDGFVTKLNGTGSSIVYSTFLGGSGDDTAFSLAIDLSGNAFITGETDDAATDYPTTTGAFDEIHNGSDDAFATKLNDDGTALIYSTFLGGSADDSGRGIAIDFSGNAFVTGHAFDSTADYPTTTGAFNELHNGSFDTFVTKLNTTGSVLRYSTFIGGNDTDNGRGIAIDSSGNAFVTGHASDSTTNYPTTTETFQPEHNGGLDAFVSKFGDYSISGRTVDTSGLALANSAIALSGDGTGFILSDAGGYFYFGDTLPTSLAGGDYLVSASQILFNFNPSNYQVNVNRNKQITFVARPTSSGPTAAFASLGGNVQSQVGNVGLANTKLTLIDAVTGDASVVHSDSNGDYEFEGLLTGQFFLVVPEKEGYDFNPGIYQVNHLQDDLSRNFVATPNAPRPVDDFDGDGKSDLAVYRPNEGNWYILESQSNNVKIVRFGLDGDIPVASDFDGDSITDIALYRPSEGNWYRINSSNEQFEAIHFGAVGDKPVQADFDGDGKTDYAVYRASTGVWHRLLSEDGSYTATKFGIASDVPISADYDSDGKADLTVFRDGTWYHQMSADNSVSIYHFGLENDKPLRGDFDGDGTIDTALYRPSSGVWYWIESSDNDIQSKQFGISTDIPTPADYNGDGRYEQSVFRTGIWFILRNDNSFYTSQFGQNGDIPIS